MLVRMIAETRITAINVLGPSYTKEYGPLVS